jgi:hypothetical protein
MTALDAQVLYRTKDLKQILAEFRGCPVPDRTLRWWRNTLGIQPDSFNCYDQTDLEILISLVKWLNRGGTIAAFKDQLLQQINGD